MLCGVFLFYLFEQIRHFCLVLSEMVNVCVFDPYLAFSDISPVLPD